MISCLKWERTIWVLCDLVLPKWYADLWRPSTAVIIIAQPNIHPCQHRQESYVPRTRKIQLSPSSSSVAYCKNSVSVSLLVCTTCWTYDAKARCRCTVILSICAWEYTVSTALPGKFIKTASLQMPLKLSRSLCPIVMSLSGTSSFTLLLSPKK